MANDFGLMSNTNPLIDDDLSNILAGVLPSTNTPNISNKNVVTPAPSVKNTVTAEDVKEGNAAIDNAELASSAAAPTETAPAPATPYLQNNSQNLLKTLFQPSSFSQANGYNQPDFTDVYNGFKTGGISGGMAKVIDYLNSPEGQQIVGGLMSKQNPYGGAWMVDKAEKQKQMMAQANMMSMNDKMKLATELVTRGDDRSIEMAKMLIGQSQFQKTFGQKEQEIQNEKDKTAIEGQTSQSNIQKNAADIAKEQAETQQGAQKIGLEGRATWDKIRGAPARSTIPTPQGMIKIQASDGTQHFVPDVVAARKIDPNLQVIQ